MAPAASIVIRSGASTLVASGPGVELEAVLQNATGPVLWGLDGPGSLSASTGATVRYTPPPGDEQRVPASARIVASTRDAMQTLTLGLTPAPGAPAPEPGRRWEVVSQPKLHATDLAWLGGRFFAVTAEGGITDSTDGIAWTHRPTPPGQLNAITQGPRGFLAVGRDTVLKSTDGRVWSLAGAAGSFHYWDVAADDRIYVAVGQSALVSSTDGATWTPSGPSIGRGLAVAHGAGRFVAAVNAPWIHTSADGRNWVQVPLEETDVGDAALAFGNGRFLLVTNNGQHSSVDGLNWVRRPGGGVRGGKLRFANGVFHLTGRDSFNRAVGWSSPDGTTWTELVETQSVMGFAGIAVADGRTVVAHGDGHLRFRLGNGPWRDALAGPSQTISGLLAVEGVMHGVTDAGAVIRSTDGRSWATVAELPAGFRGLAYGAGRYVAASDQGGQVLYTSTDGRQWTPVDGFGLFRGMSAVAFGDGVFVACGNAGEVLYSADGQAWNLQDTPVRVELTGVAHGAGRFVAVSIQGSVITSRDGRAWTEVRSDLGRMTAITHGPQGFVAVGGWPGSVGYIWTSPDGLDWTRRSDAATPPLTAVGQGSGRYMAAGRSGAVLLSTDGVTWKPLSLGVGADLHAVLLMPSRLVVAGSGGAIVLSEQ